MIVKLLTEHYLVFLSLRQGCRGSSESTHVKVPHCWKSHVLAHYYCIVIISLPSRSTNISHRDNGNGVHRKRQTRC